IIPGEFMDDPYHHDIFRGVWNVLKNSGLDLIIISQDTILDSNNPISTCIARGDVDGVIIVESMESPAQSMLERLRREFGFGQKPVITTMVDIPDSYSVLPNLLIGSKQATEYLLHNGHRHILQLSPNFAPYLAKPRLEGIFEGYKSYNLQANNYLTVRYIDYIWLDINSNIIPPATMFKDLYRTSGEEIIPYLAAHPEITAILAWNDPCAIHLINLLSSFGISVPEQISVIGHDDTFPFLDKTGNNQLTTIKIPLIEIGKAAGQLICNLTKDEPTDDIPRVLPTNLVIRKSTKNI
ncbi:MAG: LacI family DNA-binding transcriptional regulator, partial [bacterium]